MLQMSINLVSKDLKVHESQFLLQRVFCNSGGQKIPSDFGASLNWLVVSTHLKNISQNGNLPQIRVKIKNI